MRRRGYLFSPLPRPARPGCALAPRRGAGERGGRGRFGEGEGVGTRVSPWLLDARLWARAELVGSVHGHTWPYTPESLCKCGWWEPLRGRCALWTQVWGALALCLLCLPPRLQLYHLCQSSLLSSICITFLGLFLSSFCVSFSIISALSVASAFPASPLSLSHICVDLGVHSPVCVPAVLAKILGSWDEVPGRAHLEGQTWEQRARGGEGLSHALGRGGGTGGYDLIAHCPRMPSACPPTSPGSGWELS